MKQISFLMALLYMLTLPFVVGAQTYPSPTFNNVTANGQMQTNAISAIGTLGTPPTFSFANGVIQNSSVAATDIYNPLVPVGWFTVDGFRSTVVSPASATAQNTDAYGFYVRNQTVSTGLGGNAVGMYGLVTCEVNGCSSWGLNPVLSDNSTTSGLTTVNRTLIGAEFDFGVHGTGTKVQGISLNGSAIAQPSAANGFSCGNLGTPGVAYWTACFVVADNTATTGAIFGATAAASANKASIPVKFGVYDSAATGHYVQINGIPFGTNSAFQIMDNIRANGLVLTTAQTGSGPSIFPAGTDTNINLTLSGKGAGGVIAANQITAQGGINVTGGTVAVNSIPAVSCAAGTVNVSTMVVTNGIITHC